MTSDDLKRLRITAHAREVMRRRGVTVEEMQDALLYPEVTEPSKDCRRFVKNGLAYVVDTTPGKITLVTVLLRRSEQWTNADCLTRVGSPA